MLKNYQAPSKIKPLERNKEFLETNYPRGMAVEVFSLFHFAL